MPIPSELRATKPDRGVVLTKAVVRAADKLGMKGKLLACVLGVSETTLSRMKKGDFILVEGTKPYELGILFVRLFRSLDAIVGGDEAVARSWLGNPNIALDGRPDEKIRNILGLIDVIAYLDARRAVV